MESPPPLIAVDGCSPAAGLGAAPSDEKSGKSLKTPLFVAQMWRNYRAGRDLLDEADQWWKNRRIR